MGTPLVLLSAAGLPRGDPLLASLQAGLAAGPGPTAGPLDVGDARLTSEGAAPGELWHAPLQVHAAAEPRDVLFQLRAIAAAGVPLARADRRGAPLLILVGPAALPNPEVIGGFFDAVVVGDPATAVPGLVEAWAAARSAGREAVVVAWLACRGVYVPAGYHFTYREDGTLGRVEAAPGAPLPVPARWEPPALGPSPDGRRGLRAMAPFLWGWDHDARDRPRGVTAIVGAARAPLRLRAGVSLGDADLEKLLERIAEAGANRVELEFTLGLPGETDADVDGVVDLIKQLRHRLLRGGQAASRLPEIVPVVTTFSPLPWTPAQWAAMADVRDLVRRHRELARALSRVGNVSLFHDVPKWAYVQALLARGDRRMEGLFRLVLEAGGDWLAACRNWHLNGDFFVYRRRRPEEAFPWDHLDLGISKAALRQEAEARGLL